MTRFDAPRGPLTVTHTLRGSRLELVLEGPSRWWELVVDVAPPAVLRARVRDEGQDHPTSAGLHGWAVGSRSGWSGVFVQAAEVARDLLAAGDHPGQHESRVAARAAAAQVERHLRFLARALHARLAPDPVRVAQAFRPALRFFVYASVLSDPTGRVAQLARVCPGALVLAFDHLSAHAFTRRDQHRDATDRILADARAGVPLRRLVARAVDDLAALTWEGSDDPRLPVLAGATVAAREGALARQRLLVRRAGAHVRCADLTRPALPSFAPEDIPAAALRNARWYRVTSLAALSVTRIAGAALRDVISRFVSRHALLLDGWARRRGAPRRLEAGEEGVCELVTRLAAFCADTGRRPTPSCNPRAFLQEAARWVDARSPEHALADLLARVPALGLGEVTAVRAVGSGDFLWHVRDLPTPAVPDAEFEPGLSVQPIRTPDALATEGLEMEHCVAELLPRLLAGDVYVFSVRCDSERLTLAVAPGVHGGFEVVDLRRRANGEPTAAAAERVARWVARLVYPRGNDPAPRASRRGELPP